MMTHLCLLCDLYLSKFHVLFAIVPRYCPQAGSTSKNGKRNNKIDLFVQTRLFFLLFYNQQVALYVQKP